MKQTATALLLYQQNNRMKFPPSLDAVGGAYVSADAMRCVESDKQFVHVRPVVPPGQYTIANPGSLIVLYNPKGRLRSGALICGYADGHVETFKGAPADRMMSQLQAGNMRPQ